MQRTPWILAVAVAALVTPLLVHAQPAGVEYKLFVACPATEGLSVSPNGRVGCPVRAIDPSQTQILGEPALAVDPFDDTRLIFAALHGAVGSNNNPGFTCGGEPGPSARSRCNLPFTTFTSTDGGAYWQDNFFSAPAELGFETYGEHPAITIDPYGRVYVGSLYATPLEAGGFEYTIAAQKFTDLQTINAEQDGEYGVEFLGPVYPGNAIGQLWFLFNPETDNMTMLWHESVTSSSRPANRSLDATCQAVASRPSSSSSTSTSSSSSSTSSSSATSSSSSSSTGPAPLPATLAQSPNLVVPGPKEAGGMSATGDDVQGQANSSAARSVIGVVWTRATSDSCYLYQPHPWSIGPCERSTNPVLSEGWLYVGCVAKTDEAGGFPWNPDTAAGTVELFRMRPDGGEPQYLGPSNIVGGLPKLGVRSDGRLALATAFTEDGLLRLAIEFGQYDPGSRRIDWSSHQSLGSRVTSVDPRFELLGANVQDLIFREHSGVVHLILKERIRPGLSPTEVAGPLRGQQVKHIVAIDEHYGLLAKLPLDVGNPVNRTNPALWEVPEDAFDDLSDDFLQYPEVDEYRYRGPSGVEHVLDHYQREFFAVGDYGEVIFAEVIEVTNLRGPAYATGGAGTLPQAAPASSPTSAGSVVPAAGLTMVGALALALLATKRKQAVLTRAKLGKGNGPPNERRGP